MLPSDPAGNAGWSCLLVELGMQGKDWEASEGRCAFQGEQIPLLLLQSAGMCSTRDCPWKTLLAKSSKKMLSCFLEEAQRVPNPGCQGAGPIALVACGSAGSSLLCGAQSSACLTLPALLGAGDNPNGCALTQMAPAISAKQV